MTSDRETTEHKLLCGKDTFFDASEDESTGNESDLATRGINQVETITFEIFMNKICIARHNITSCFSSNSNLIIQHCRSIN